MLRDRRTLLALVLLGLALPPVASGHAADEHGGAPHDDGGFVLPPPPRGTARPDEPIAPYHSYYQGAWLYGTHHVRVLGQQVVRDLAGDDEWLVWSDALSSRVYAFNIPAGDGFFVAPDTFGQFSPDVSSGVVVWEDRRGGSSNIVAYFLDTGETRRITRDSDDRVNRRNPSVAGAWVAWEDDRDGNWAVYAYDLRTDSEYLVSGDASARNVDPVISGRHLVYRTYRFNVWDVKWVDLETGEGGSVTSDRGMELAPFRAGDEVLFLKETKAGFLLLRWDPESRLTHETHVHFSSPTSPAADGDRLVQTSFEGPLASFVARNLTNGLVEPVTGFLPIMDTPVLSARTLFVPVWNGSDAAILSLDVNPFAFLQPPRLDVAAPADGAVVRDGRVPVRGTITFEKSWGEPDAFFYSVNGRNHTRIVPSEEWSVVIDMSGRSAGAYTVTLEAHYPDAPPLVRTFTVVVPSSFQGTDLEEAGHAFHAARLQGIYYRYVGNNPAILALTALVVGLIGLWVVKYRLVVRPRRKGVVEYVRPEE